MNKIIPFIFGIGCFLLLLGNLNADPWQDSYSGSYEYDVFLDIDGSDTMTGNLDMGGYKILNTSITIIEGNITASTLTVNSSVSLPTDSLQPIDIGAGTLDSDVIASSVAVDTIGENQLLETDYDISVDTAAYALNSDQLDGNNSTAYLAVAGDTMEGNLTIAGPNYAYIDYLNSASGNPVRFEDGIDAYHQDIVAVDELKGGGGYFTNGPDLDIHGGFGYPYSGNYSGGDLILHGGNKTPGGAGADGHIKLQDVTELNANVTTTNAEITFSTNVYVVGYSSATEYYGDGSNLTGISSSVDNLGNHTATTTLTMGSFSIQSSSSIHANEYFGDGSNLTGVGGGGTPDVYGTISGDVFDSTTTFTGGLNSGIFKSAWTLGEFVFRISSTTTGGFTLFLDTAAYGASYGNVYSTAITAGQAQGKESSLSIAVSDDGAWKMYIQSTDTNDPPGGLTWSFEE